MNLPAILIILSGTAIAFLVGMFVGWRLFHPDKEQLNELIKNSEDNTKLDNTIKFDVSSIIQL